MNGHSLHRILLDDIGWSAGRSAKSTSGRSGMG
jgi:hypothetical protein